MHDMRKKKSMLNCIFCMECGMMYVCHYMCILGGSSPCRRISLLGIAYPVVGPPFMYRECTGRRRSDETVIAKKADM